MTLRTRLALGFTLLFAVVLAAGVFVVTAQRNQLYDQVDAQLLATPVPPQLRAPQSGGGGGAGGGGGDAPRPQTGARDEQVDSDSISDLYVAIVFDDGELQSRIEGQLLVDVPDVSALAAAMPTESTLITADGVDGISTFRVLFVPGTAEAFSVVVAVPIDAVDDTVQQLTYTFAGVAGAVLLTLILIASWVTRFGLRPISALTDVAEGISSGDRDRRAEIEGDSTEAGRLGHAFNVMLDERDASDERLRQFVSNASHELRTPLTSIRGYLDLYTAGGFRKPGELEDAVRRMSFEAERMNLLVDDLLLLAKFDEEQPLDIGTVRLDELVRDVAALTLAAHPDRNVVVDVPDEIKVEADLMRLHQACAALVDNAVRHTPADAEIRVSARRTESAAELSVADSGPGLSHDEAATVFDRFSRGDSSRARTTGGSGLGLSITQAIVHAHGGEISVTATPGHGATFTIALPSGR